MIGTPLAALRSRLAAYLMAAWLLGVASGLGYIGLSGGWYEYHFFTYGAGAPDITYLLNDQGWQMVPGIPAPAVAGYLRRPRIRLP